MSEEDRGIILRRDGQQFGPYTREETVRYLNNGSLFLGDLARVEGENQWRSLSAVLGAEAPQPAQHPPLPSQPKVSSTRALLIVMTSGAFLLVLILFGRIAGISSRSAEGTVRSFLDAVMTHEDGSRFLADGVDANRVTTHEVTSYELNNVAEDVVSATLHIRGHEMYYKPQFNTAGGYSGDLTIGAVEVDTPRQIRFRVRDGKIVEIF